MFNMNLAIVFWFYKKPRICINRLRLIKKTNPDLKIYGLYGGEKNQADYFKKILNPYLDDFYTSPYEDSDWKWRHGDLMILDWYERRGKRLEWDSVAVIQWDMLVFGSLRKIFRGMKKGQIYLSGFRLLNKSIEQKWHWTQSNNPSERRRYEEFLDFIKINYKYKGPVYVCLFIFQIFPRVFFEKYTCIKKSNREIGFLEYKIPMLVKAFDIPVFKKDLGVLWFKNEIKPLNAVSREIDSMYIQNELKKKNGWRIFHPYFKLWK